MMRAGSCILPGALLLWAVSVAADESRAIAVEDDRHERVPLNTVAPVYPAAARRERIEGDVQVCFNVDREGRPYRIAVRTSTNRVFEKPAIRAIRESRYQRLPADQPVPAIKTCRTFRFRLESLREN